jgi:hypothetical protein
MGAKAEELMNDARAARGRSAREFADQLLAARLVGIHGWVGELRAAFLLSGFQHFLQISLRIPELARPAG